MAEPLEDFQENEELSAAKLTKMARRVNALSNIVSGPEGIFQAHVTDANVMLEFKGVPFNDVVENGVLSTYLVAKRTGPA